MYNRLVSIPYIACRLYLGARSTNHPVSSLPQNSTQDAEDWLLVDRDTYMYMSQDVTHTKTMLHKLRRLLQDVSIATLLPPSGRQRNWKLRRSRQVVRCCLHSEHVSAYFLYEFRPNVLNKCLQKSQSPRQAELVAQF